MNPVNPESQRLRRRHRQTVEEKRRESDEQEGHLFFFQKLLDRLGFCCFATNFFWRLAPEAHQTNQKQDESSDERRDRGALDQILREPGDKLTNGMHAV